MAVSWHLSWNIGKWTLWHVRPAKIQNSLYFLYIFSLKLTVHPLLSFATCISIGRRRLVTSVGCLFSFRFVNIVHSIKGSVKYIWITFWSANFQRVIHLQNIQSVNYLSTNLKEDHHAKAWLMYQFGCFIKEKKPSFYRNDCSPLDSHSR